MRTWLLLGIAITTGACASVPIREQLLPRAPFDLNCPAEQVEVTQRDPVTAGASGCGRRITYVARSCGFTRCSWAANVGTEVGSRPSL